MIAQFIAENSFVLGCIVLLTAFASRTSSVARLAFALGTAALIGRYIWWRWSATVEPINIFSISGAWIWLCFAVEFLTVVDSLLNIFVLSRHIDRKPEADEGESWIRAQDPLSLPSVDIVIPTYNEDLSVLERSIVGALSLEYPNSTVWVLDDGNRPWLSTFCVEKGAKYLTRSDRSGAKAGNINAALPRLKGDLIAVLDADFVPRWNFLLRTVGFFRDPTIACVQTPQAFFNKDPIQINLGLGSSWSDDQRFFFDIIMPSRDAWSAAFCCGTGFVMRRSALDTAGGFPTASVCEDMLLTLGYLRQGARTVYLNEELCVGLAPESLQAYFIQRKRWCRGQIQMMYLRAGQFGPGLSFTYRLLFLPTYWALFLPSRIFMLIVPLLYLWAGLSPFQSVDQWELWSHLGPALIANIAWVSWVAPRAYFPILTDATNVFLATHITPTAFASVIKPFGEPFRVTPKGHSVRANGVETGSFWFCFTIFLLTLSGLAWNAFLPIHPIENMDAFPVVAVWGIINCVIAAYAALIARERPRYRAQERFPLQLAAMGAVAAESFPCAVVDASLSGAFVRFGNHPVPPIGSEIRISTSTIGIIRGRIVRQRGDGAGIYFEHLDSETRGALNRLLLSQMQVGSVPGRQAYRLRVDIAGTCVTGSEWSHCTIVDASLSGAFISFADGCAMPEMGAPMTIDFPEVGLIDAIVVRTKTDGVGISFENVSPDMHDCLIRLLYTVPRPIYPAAVPNVGTMVSLMGRAAFGPDAA